MKKPKNIIIGILILTIFIMGIGYSSFATTLNINGQAEITGEWDVKITNVEVASVSEESDGGTPEFTNTSLTFNAKLNKPGDTITYIVTITNAGTIDAKLNNVIFSEGTLDSSDAISYKTSEIAETLKANEKTAFQITVSYKKDITENPEIKTKTITGIIEYVQK